MSGQVEFNSNFLSELNREWKGIFYDKFIRFYNVLQNQKDLKIATQALFHFPKVHVANPTETAFKNFGKGNFARDAEVLQFLDGSFWSRTSIQQDIVPNELLSHSTLEKYRILQNALQGKDIESLQLKTLEDLSFLGCLALIQQKQFNEGKKLSEIIKYNYDSVDVVDIGNQNHLNIETSSFEEKTGIISAVLKSSKTIVPSLNSFIAFNQMVQLQNVGEDLNKQIPEILFSSGQLWQEEVFSFNPSEVESMDVVQKTESLIANKSKVLHRCFETLLEGQSKGEWGEQQNKPLRELLSKWNDLTKWIYIKEVVEDVVEKGTLGKEEIKKRFVGIAKVLGVSEEAAALNLVDLMVHHPQEIGLEGATEVDKFLLHIASLYRKKTLDVEGNKQEIKNNALEIESRKQQLTLVFEGAMNSVRNLFIESTEKRLNILKAYATFVFVLDNERLFPKIDKQTKTESYQKASNILKQFIKKPFERLKGNQGPFQDIFNQRITEVLKPYKRAEGEATYQGRAITEQEMKDLDKVAQTLQSSAEGGDRSAVSKYQKLEAILHEFLYKDQAFQEALKQTGNLSSDKVLALNSHFYACSLLANSQQTGSASLIEKLLQKVHDSISDQGIKESIVKNTAGIIKSAEALGLTASEESVESLINAVIVGRNYESLGDLAIEQRESPSSKQIGIQQAQAKVQEDLSYISNALKGGTTWLKSVFYDLSDKPSSKLYKGRIDEPLGKETLNAVKEELNGSIPENFPKTINEALRQLQICIVENSLKSPIVHPLHIGPRRSIREEGIEQGKLLAKAWRVNQLKIMIEVSSTPTFEVVPKSVNPLSVDRQIDLFNNKTLFQFYNESSVEGERNQNLSENLYHEFLPIFVSSFVNIEGLFGTGVFGKSSLMQTKAELIKNLPGSETIINDIIQYLETNAQKIHALQNYLQGEVQRQSQELSQNPEKIPDFMQKVISQLDFITPAMGWVKEGLVFALKSSVVAFLTLKYLQPYINWFPSITHPLFSAAVLFLSFVGVKFSQDTAIPFLKKSVSTAWEWIKAVSGIQEYSTNAPMECLLNLLDLSLESELGAINQIPFLDNQTLFCSYMQSTFNAVEEMSYNLANFSSRLNQLTPPYKTQANLSVMALNMLFYFNSDVMRILPQELLRSANHPQFLSAVRQYLTAYKLTLDDAGKNYKGKKELVHSGDTGYESYLKAEVVKTNRALYFSSDSSVGQCLGRNQQAFRLTPESIVPYEKIDPEASAKNLEMIVNKSKAFSERKKRSQEKLYPIVFDLQKAKKNVLFHEKDLEKFAITLLSSYEVVVEGFQMAEALTSANLGLNLEEDHWLRGTKERPRSIFTSRLFQDALSFLENTFHSLVALGQPTEDLRDLNSLKLMQKEFLETNMANLPPFWLIDKLRQRTRTLAENIIKRKLNVNGALSFVFSDLKLNPKFQVPVIIWTKMKSDLLENYGENARGVQQLLETSPLLYLTGEGNRLLFASPELRGSQFSFWVINALEKASIDYHSMYIDQLRRRETLNMPIPQSITNRMPYMQQHITDQNVEQGEAPKVAPIYPSQRWMKPNEASTEIDQETGLAPVDYNPDNTNLSPQDALHYYGERLPEGVRNQIQQQYPGQVPFRAGVSQQSTSPLSIQSPPQMQQQQQNFLPMLMAPPVEEEQQLQQQPLQQPAQGTNAEAEQPIMVGVDSSGASRSLSGGSNVYDNQFSDRIRQQADESRQRVQEWQQNAPNPLPNPSGQPYVNPINAGYNPMIAPQDNGSFDWGTAAKIGGGAALGAGLLGYALSNRDKKKRGGRK